MKRVFEDKKGKKKDEGVKSGFELVLKMSNVRKQTFEHNPQIDYSSFMKFLL